MKKFAEIILSLKDEVSKSVSAVGSAFLGLTKILASVGAGLMATFIEYGKQEEAVRKLDTALKNSGMATQASTERLIELASQLQKTTKFADDTTLSAMSMLGTFGLNEKSIATLIPKLQDMATAMDGNLVTAAITAGKAISSGQIGMLTKYGVVLDETKFKTDPVIAVTDALTKQYDGQARAVAKGPLGALAKLKNMYSELMETIGSIVAGPMTDFMNKLSDMMVKLMESKQEIQFLTDVFFFLGETIMGVFTMVGEIIGTFVAGLVSNMEIITMILTGDFAGAIEQFKSMNAVAAESVNTSWNNMVNTIKSSYAKINAERVADANKEKANTVAQQKAMTEKFAWQNAEQKKQDTKEIKDLEEKQNTIII